MWTNLYDGITIHDVESPLLLANKKKCSWSTSAHLRSAFSDCLLLTVWWQNFIWFMGPFLNNSHLFSFTLKILKGRPGWFCVKYRWPSCCHVKIMFWCSKWLQVVPHVTIAFTFETLLPSKLNQQTWKYHTTSTRWAQCLIYFYSWQEQWLISVTKMLEFGKVLKYKIKEDMTVFFPSAPTLSCESLVNLFYMMMNLVCSSMSTLNQT